MKKSSPSRFKFAFPFLFLLPVVFALIQSCSSKPAPTTPQGPAPNTSTATPSPTNSPTSTGTVTATKTATNTPSNSPTNTPTPTISNTFTTTPTNSPTATPTNSPTITPTNSPTNSPTITPTNTPTDTPTNSPTNTPTSTPTNTFMPTPVQTNSWPMPPGVTAWGLSVSGSQVYVANNTNSTVREFSLDGTPVPVATWPTPSVPQIIGVTTDGSGNVYTGSFGSLGINVFNAQATPVATFSPGNSIGNLKFDGTSSIYAPDLSNNNVKVYSTAGALLNTLPAPIAPLGLFVGPATLYIGSTNKGGPILNTNLSGSTTFSSWVPYSAQGVDAIAVDGTGRIYVATGNWGSGPIIRYSASGNLETEWGNYSCFGLAFDASGNLFVTDINTGVHVFHP